MILDIYYRTPRNSSLERVKLTSSLNHFNLSKSGIYTGLLSHCWAHLYIKFNLVSVLHSLLLFVISNLEYPVILDDDVNVAAHKS